MGSITAMGSNTIADSTERCGDILSDGVALAFD